MNLIDLFLDTTPRQWYFKAKILLFWILSSMLQSYQNLSSMSWADWKQFCFQSFAQNRFKVVSLCLHMAIFGLIQLNLSQNPKALLEKGDELVEVSFGTSLDSADVENVYDSESDIYLPEKKKSSKQTKKTQSPEDRLKKLLAQMNQQKNPNLKEQDLSQLLKQQSLTQTKGSSSALQKKLSGISFDPAQEIKGLDAKSLLQTIQSQSGTFKKCYENALLMDGDLTGQVSVTLQIRPQLKSSRAQVRFSGQGTSNSQDKLTNCLEDKAESLSFKNMNEEVTIKFNLFFMG